MAPPTLLAVSQRKWKNTPLAHAYGAAPAGTKLAVLKKFAKIVKTARFKKQRVPRGITTMFPTKKFVKLLYTDQSAVFSGTTQSTFGTARQYNLNSLFLPRTGGTTRPQGFAEMAVNYNRYKVFGAKVKVTFSNTTIDGMWCGVRAQQSGGTDSITGETVSVASMKRWTSVKPMNNTGSQIVHYSRYWNIAALEGLTKIQMGADLGTLSALTTASPARIPILEVACANATTGSDENVQFKTEIEFYAQFFDRETFATS